MAKIVLSTMGSLGDLHPMIALAVELRDRGHVPVINTWEGYAEKIAELGFEYRPLRPNIDQNDRELLKLALDARKGPETVIRDMVFPNLRDMYDDLEAACDGADLVLNGEIVYAASSLAEKTGVKWISTSLAPLSMFSAYDPSIYPTAEFLEYLRPMPAVFHRSLFHFMRWTISDWYEPVRGFRRGLGLSEDVDPVFEDKYSPLLHLALFSKAIGRPQPDWHSPTLQTGFCFYDDSDGVGLNDELGRFLDGGEAPIVFTLGSAASLDAGSFFEESVMAARKLGRRAVMLYGRDNEPPPGLDKDIVGFEFAPYSLVFPHAACVVHQAGIGTTAQALRAGVPQLIVPFSHDQPDNGARMRRRGVAEMIGRYEYNASTAAAQLRWILGNGKYTAHAAELKHIVDREAGTKMACDAIEEVLRK